ncbi:MAG: DUF5067 domain-containing protein [Lachnospiraceae bacterium]|nr:DUF5067 domain-containing protein [Lachnospiraceae bacterium]
MKRIFVILLVLSMLLTAVGCSNTGIVSVSTDAAQNTDLKGPGPESARALAGAYKLTGMTGGSEGEMKIVSTMVSMGAKCYLFLEEDGTGRMNFMEAEMPLRWDDSSIIIRLEADGGENEPIRIPFTGSEGILQISTSEYSMDFGRLTDEELAYYEENGPGSLKGQIGSAAQKLAGGVEESLTDILFFALMSGMSSYEPEPIPEGEPTEGTVSGLVDGMEITILGAEEVYIEDSPCLVFYFDAVNRSDALNAAWLLDIEASQDGSFLEYAWDTEIVPELHHVDYDIAPGRKIRCAYACQYDPEGGTAGFRVCSYHDDAAVIYYADPKNLSGAPAEPFAFDSDPSIPGFLEGIAEESEDIRIEKAEFFTDEDGNDAVRFYFTFRNLSENESVPLYYEHGSYAFQDGIALDFIWSDEETEEEQNLGEEAGPGEELLCARSFVLRTGSPIAFTVYEEGDDGTEIFEAVKVFEVPES